MKRKLIFSFWILSFFLFKLSLIAQYTELKGRVIDEKTQKPLPFVNIVYNIENKGFTSDIDGWFYIPDISKLEFLKFSYVGYDPVSISKSGLAGKSSLIIKMNEKTFDIDEVTIHPGENPAHRIIKAVVKNRKANDPKRLSSYSYKAYHKMYFTAKFDEKQEPKSDTIVKSDTIRQDSSYLKAINFLDSQYLFLMESVSERKYKRPGKTSEKVLASRVSGLKEPSFILLATQMQSFSFYDEMIHLMESRYINPISHGSTGRYFFNIEDTTYTERGDTVFSISFRPRNGKKFESLKGVLNINSYKYAIQSVVAEPIENNGIMDIKIQQNYELIEDKYWFPKELNTDIIFINLVNAQAGKHKLYMLGVGKSYITDIELNNEYRNAEFSAIEVEVDKAAFKQNDSIWNKYRKDSLSKQELRTYKSIDSIGEEHKLDLKLKFYKTLFTGYLPFHFLDIKMLSLLDFNVYEGFRPGLGLRTNDKISKYFSIGGYAAYGFKDEQWKYGGKLDFNIAPRQEFKLGVSYSNDIEESAGYQFLEEHSALNSTEAYRYFFINDMTYKVDYTANIEFRTLKRWKINLFASQKVMKNTSDYYFTNDNVYDESSKKYNFQEAGIQLKFAPNESKAFVAGELFSSNPGSSPVLYVNLIKGFKNQKSDFDYTKIEGRLNFSFLTKSFGRTNIQLVSGKVIGDLPYFLLYNGHASYYDFTVETANSFATMRMNEFLSDEFFSIHFRQDFGGLLFKTKKFRPEFVITTSIGYGQLQKPDLHNAINFNTLEKGYYESGLQINNLIMYFKIIGFGFGVYYRYGAYSYSNNSDNFAYKITMNFKL